LQSEQITDSARLVAVSGARRAHPPTVLVLDDFGMRELTAPQADDLYELITDRAGKSLILTSNGRPPTGIRCSPTRSSPSLSWTGSSTTATSTS
jgi:hypothetical protein